MQAVGSWLAGSLGIRDPTLPTVIDMLGIKLDIGVFCVPYQPKCDKTGWYCPYYWQRMLHLTQLPLYLLYHIKIILCESLNWPKSWWQAELYILSPSGDDHNICIWKIVTSNVRGICEKAYERSKEIKEKYLLCTCETRERKRMGKIWNPSDLICGWNWFTHEGKWRYILIMNKKAKMSVRKNEFGSSKLIYIKIGSQRLEVVAHCALMNSDSRIIWDEFEGELCNFLMYDSDCQDYVISEHFSNILLIWSPTIYNIL